MISAVEETSYDTLRLVTNIKTNMMTMKNVLRIDYKFYSQELLNHLFKQPYTKVEFLQKDLNISLVKASTYLNKLADDKIFFKYKLVKTNYYINTVLMEALNPNVNRN